MDSYRHNPKAEFKLVKSHNIIGGIYSVSDKLRFLLLVLMPLGFNANILSRMIKAPLRLCAIDYWHQILILSNIRITNHQIKYIPGLYMCWSKEVSLGSFLIAISGCLYLYNRNKPNDRWISLFGGTISFIQLAEYFIWKSNTENCDNMNKYASMAILFILFMEPLSNMIGGLIYNDKSNNSLLNKIVPISTTKILTILLILYIGLTVFLILTQNQIDWCAKPFCNTQNQNTECNLKWNFLDSIGPTATCLWMIFLLAPLLAMTPISEGLILFGAALITFTMSRIYNYGAIGSLWCWLAISVIYIKIAYS